METSLPTPMTARVELLIYQRVYGKITATFQTTQLEMVASPAPQAALSLVTMLALAAVTDGCVGIEFWGYNLGISNMDRTI